MRTINNEEKETARDDKKVLEKDYEFNTTLSDYLIDTNYFSEGLPIDYEEIQQCLKNPMANISKIRKVAWWAYNSNGAVSSGIDYMRSMHTLDGFVCSKSPTDSDKPKKSFQKAKEKFQDCLDRIQYKSFIRDALLKDSNDGMCVYYFETSKQPKLNGKYISDIDVENIVEINSDDYNVAIISLPIEWCRIVSRKNSCYEIAFDLRYFLQFDGSETTLKRKLASMPKEIRQGWSDRSIKGSLGGFQVDKPWIRLNTNNTIVHKIKAPKNKPYGIPIAISALDDVLYCDYFTKTKREVLDRVNNQIFYETFPVEDGKAILTKTQQEQQHNIVKGAILNKSNKNGLAFFSLAGGTKLDKISVDTGIFDEKNENATKDSVPQSLGFAPTVLYGASSSGSNYATALLNLEMIASNIYSWIEDIVAELNKCINANVIKNKNHKLGLYIYPTTYMNREKTFDLLSQLYTNCGGSLQALIASTGINPDVYLSMMNYERSQKFDEKYPPHSSMYQQSGKENTNKDVGRPKDDDSTNENTQISKGNNSNDNPKPSIGL